MPSYAITGASRGLGLELVRQLSATPDNVVFALVRNPDKAPSLKDLALARDSHVHILTADVTDSKSLLAAASAVGELTGGALDVLIHNAFDMDLATIGLLPSQLPFEREALEAVFSKSMGTDVFGTIWTTNAFLPLIEKGVEKKVIHISTGLTDLDLIKTTGIAYAVAGGVGKSAMNILSAKYAAEFDKKVKFLALSPGWVNSAGGPSKSSLSLMTSVNWSMTDDH